MSKTINELCYNMSYLCPLRICSNWDFPASHCSSHGFFKMSQLHQYSWTEYWTSIFLGVFRRIFFPLGNPLEMGNQLCEALFYLFGGSWSKSKKIGDKFINKTSPEKRKVLETFRPVGLRCDPRIGGENLWNSMILISKNMWLDVTLWRRSP